MILDIFDIRESLSFFFNHKISFCILLELMFDCPAFPLQSFRKWEKGMGSALAKIEYATCIEFAD